MMIPLKVMISMKLSEATIEAAKDYCGISNSDSDNILGMIVAGARAFVLGYTGLALEDADYHEDITLAFMTLVNEMYTNRTYTVELHNLNPFARQILDLYRVNLL